MIAPPRPTLAAAGMALALCVSLPLLADDEGTARTERAAIGGALSWFFGDDLDLLGDMCVDLPWRLREDTDLFFALDARTNIRKAASDFAFLVQDIDYSAELGLRAHAFGGPLSGSRAAVFAGQTGTQRVDADGQPWVRYVGVGLESAGFRDLVDGFQWRVAAAAVLDEREIEADAVLRAEARMRRWGPLGLDLRLESLPGGGELRGDVRAGPSLWLRTGSTRRLSLFAHYIDSENPLGLGSSGLLVGMDFSESGNGSLPRFTPPDVAGTIGSGAGDGRVAGLFALRMLSPTFADDLRVVLEVEGDILTADDTGEVYWLYHVGVERERGAVVLGAWFYHRSNHTLAEPNDRITFINVIEIGAETAGWGRSGRTRRRIGARLRAGYLASSSFGEERRWHVRTGARWTPLPARERQPFLQVEAEAGDLERYLFALGIAVAEDVELRLEYREDEQYFGADRNAALFMARLGF